MLGDYMSFYQLKSILAALAISIIISNCSSNSEVVINRWTNGSVKVAKNFYHRDTLLYQLISYFENGQTKEIAHFEGKIKNGWNITYYESGGVQDSVYFQEDLPISISRHFYENGSPLCDGTYLDGQKDGPWYFYDSAGILTHTIDYQYGQTGKTSFFDVEGWLIKELERYPQGLVKEVINYQDSIKHGPYELYDENGNFKLTGEFIAGGRAGTRWVTYHNSGNKFSEVEYRSEHEHDALLVNLWDLSGDRTIEDGDGYFKYYNYANCKGEEIVESETILYYRGGEQIDKRVIAKQNCD